MRRQSRRLGLLAGCGVLLTCCLPGCGGGPKLPPLAKVSGTVTFNGKPVTSGMIAFVPDVTKGPDGSLGVGSMDQNGRYTIFTTRQEGALIGWHNVRIQDPFTGAPPKPLPSIYGNADTSGLTAEVKAGQDNVIDFELPIKR